MTCITREFMFTLTPVTVTLFSRPQGRPDALQLPCSYSYGSLSSD